MTGQPPSAASDDVLPPELVEFHQDVRAQLDALVERGDGDLLRALCARYFDRDVTLATFSEWEESVRGILGPQAVSSLTYLASTPPDALDSALDEFEFAPPTRKFVRELLVFYGAALELAANMAERPLGRVDDWRMAATSAYLELDVDQYIGTITITKFSGERMRIEGSASSMLRLARRLLLHVIDFGTPDAFSPSDIERYRAAVADFESMVDPTKLDAEPPETTAGDAATGPG